jgi:succinate dehydrogenase / fumarate reductase, cytochrome b subunit
MPNPTTTRPRPLSPNVQIYRPQLTSVLSILNRITGIFLSACAVVLVVWLVAAAWGPQTYAPVQATIASRTGRIVLFGATFAFFLHLCGSIRHLVWDTVHGFELRSIYISGWSVVGASVLLTIAAWFASASIGG